MINCIQLYQPETLLIEYDQEYLEEDIFELFDKERISHVKSYPYCSFVHFYSHNGKNEFFSSSKIHNRTVRRKPTFLLFIYLVNERKEKASH